MTTSSTTKQLLDRVLISEQIYRYCRAVDRLDRQLGYSIWHEDGIADYGDIYYGDGPGLIDLICEQHRHALCHSHQVSNIIIDLDGDRAGSEAYVTANLRISQNDRHQQLTIWSRYIDQWSCRDNRWAIDKRITVIDLDEIREVQPLSSQQSRSTRDYGDPSYLALRDLQS